MSATTIVQLVIVAGLVIRLWIAWRQRVRDAKEMDATYRRDVLRRNKTKPMNEEEEDYILKLRAGRKPKNPHDPNKAPED